MKKLLLTFLIAFITALGLNAEVKTATFDNNDCSGDIASEISIANGDIKISVTKNSNGNGVKYFSSKPAAFRMYGGASMKFTCTNSGEKITKIEFTMSTTNGTWQDKSSSTPTGFNTSTNTWESTEGAQTVTITNGGSSGNTRFTKVVITYGSGQLPTSCEAPTFNFEENAEVTTGDVIKATCSTENSTVYLKVGDGEFEQTDSYTITKSLATGPLKFEAYATVQGKDGIIESDHKILNVNVVKILGNIKYNGEAVPDTISLKGGETLTFTSANAVSMTLVANGDEAHKITTLDTGEISWPAPAAKESEQTYALSITSKLDDAVKTANTTVTVAKKPTVETFELLTDLNDVNEENTYILFGTAEKNPDGNQHLMNTTVNKFFGTFKSADGYFTISKDKSIIEIPPTTTGVAYITLEKTTTEGSYKLKVGEQYIKFAGEKNVALTETKADGNDFTISFDTTKNNSIQIKSGNYILAYNASNPRFTSYGVSTNLGRQHLYVKKAAPSVKVPGEVTSMPAAVEGVITINKNEEITFSSKDAAKLQVSTQSEPVVGSSYKYTPTVEGEVTITPIDSEGKVYTEKAATFTIKFFKGLVDGTISYKTNTFTYTIGSEATLPELVKEPADVDVEYSISHKRVENGVAVYHPATIDEQGNITVNTPGIVTVTATVKADRSKTASYVLEIQSLKEAEIAGTGSATPTGNIYTKVEDSSELNHSTLYAILSYSAGKVYALAPGNAGANEGLKAVLIKEGETALNSTYTIDNSAVANMLYDENGYLTYDYNSTVYYLTSLSLRHMEWTDKASEAQAITYRPWVESSGDGTYYDKSLLLGTSALLCNASEKYFNAFSTSNPNFNNTLFNCFLYKVGTAMSSASTVKAPVVHITGGNVYYSLDGEWYWGTEDESHKLSFANETDDAQIYYTMTSATPSSANVRAMANSATGTLYSTPFKKSDLNGMKLTFWAEKDGQKSAVETLNFNIKTGIEDIDVENGEAIEEEGDARYFNLQGLEVKNPGEGIYIRVANGKATKIQK